MIDLVLLFIGVLTIAWLRKTDISRIFVHPVSVKQISTELANPKYQYLEFIKIILFNTIRYLSKYYQEKYFSLLLLSITVISFLIIVSSCLFGANAVVVRGLNPEIAEWKVKLSFLLVVLLFLICFMINKYGDHFEAYMRKKIQVY